MAHTPGPWEAIIEKSDGNFAHSIYSEGYDGLLVARCNQNGNHDADACLIAAAPELLEALKQIVDVLRKEAPGTKLNNHRFDALGIKCYAAIAKAEGHE